MTATAEPITAAAREAVERLLDVRDHVVVCLSGLSVHTNGSPIFGCIVYGPFTKDEVEQKASEIRRLEGGAILIRPLVDLTDTYRRISAD
jgi:hypothetical protein